MRRSTLMAAVVAACALASIPASGGRETESPDSNDEAMQLAKKLTDEGAATFNTASAKAMADYYLDDAKIFLVTKNDDGTTIKEYDGRQEIEDGYDELFKDKETIRSKNHVEYAKLLASDLLVIAGIFEPNQLATDPLKIPFYQVRVKQGDKWLIQSLRIFFVPKD